MKIREIKANRDFGICAVCEAIYTDLKYDIDKISKEPCKECGVEGMLVIFRAAEEPISGGLK